MKALLLAVTLAPGCIAPHVSPATSATAQRVPADGRPADDDHLFEYARIFIPVERHATEICVEYQDGEEFFEDCIEAGDFHAVMRSAGRVP